MSIMWKKEFTPNSVLTPRAIVEEQCTFLSDKTENCVIGKIADYDRTFDTTNILHETVDISSYKLTTKPKRSIQDELGELKKSEFRYEFFITSTYTPNYKYRVFFLEYGISSYPLTMYLDESISKELGFDSFALQFENEKDFKLTLDKILNSEKLTNVINSLYSLAVKEG